MEPSKAQGKRSLAYKARDEAAEEEEEEEEEEEDEDGALGFPSGEDDYIIRKKRQLMISTAAAGGGAGARPGRGSGSGGSTVRPSCQADSCNVDLSEAKNYHRRHKICETHAKEAVVLVAGLQQRFCQQCSRFHGLSEFDDAKRSCRRRLAGHNERRRKSSSELITREGSN